MIDDQSNVIAFLSNPSSFGDDCIVERVETHISIVFLVGERAYKLKKAVRLSYLDFSTAALRERLCRDEVALNAASVSGIYLGTRRITRTRDGKLEFGGTGPLVDAVVEMVRFPQDKVFDQLAIKGLLNEKLMTEVARTVALHHSKAPVVATENAADSVAEVLGINKYALQGLSLFPSDQVGFLTDRYNAVFQEKKALITERGKTGRVRRCHGDLHLRNIVLLNGHPCLFDCLEFNMKLATTDVMYDLAFLLMDLWHRRLFDLANITMNRYLDLSGDEQGLSLLSFFMAVRAAVRAHVIGLQAQAGGGLDTSLVDEAQSYFDLANKLLMKEPHHVIAIGGLSGSGKSTIAEKLAPQIGPAPGARIIETDRVRKALCGVSADTRLSQDAYARGVSVRVYEELAHRVSRIADFGGDVVATGVFLDPDARIQIETAAGPAFLGIWLDAPVDTLRHRIIRRVGGPSDADLAVLESQLAKDAGPLKWKHVDADKPASDIITDIEREVANLVELHPLGALAPR